MSKNIEELMQKRWVRILIALIIPALFLIIGFLTISDYGITWDEPLHFMRGEAYFHYFLTGKKDYSDLSTRNIYQSAGCGNFKYWMKFAHRHPPLNGILSSLSVEIFYKRLGILGNIDAHHSIILILGALCILAVYLFASEAYGRLAGLVAALSLSLYPFFLVACHNKIKAGPETAFFTLTVWSLWKGLKDRNWKWVLTSSLFCGFALATKFNIIFLPFIVLPWFLTLLRSRLIGKERLFSPSLLVSFFLYPLLPLVILYACWPWLWPAPLQRLLEVVTYYKTVGTYRGEGWDMIVLGRAIFRTPFPVLLLSSIGIGYALTHFWKEKNKTSLLVLLWLLVPIIRAIAPGMTVYGSIHRLAEYIPPLCILAGVGAKILFLRLRSFLATRGLIK
ncbi:glycosyltransferase family 39 protein, partial [bacterium]|nr:glycosyltransferase family 39 protein [bacterium]